MGGLPAPTIDKMRERLQGLRAARRNINIDQPLEELHPDRIGGSESTVLDDVRRQEKIQKLAQEMFLNRTSLDPGNKETGPSEFDLRAAEVAYDAAQKQDNPAKSDTLPDASGSPKLEDTLRRQAKENQRQIDSGTAEDARAEDIVDEGRKRSIEIDDIAQAELNQAITDFEAKQSQIAEMRAQKTGRFASLAKSLGIKPRNLDDDPEVMGLEKESHDLYRNLMAKGIHLYKGNKPQLENFLRQFDEFEVFRATYNKEIDKRAEVCGWPENVLASFHKIGKRWSELKPWQKIAISAAGGLGIAGGALAVGAGTFGAAALGAGWRWGFRGFGAMAVGIGRSVQLEKKMMKEIDQDSEGWLKEKMNILDKYENDLDQGIEDIMSQTGIIYIRKNIEQRSLENNREAVKLATKTFIISSIVGESLRLGGQYTGINMGSIIKKIGGYVGFGGGTQQVIESAQNSPAGGSYDQFQKPSGASAVTEQQAGSHMNAEISENAGQPHQMEYSGGSRATESGANFAEQSQTEKASSFIEEARTSPAAGAEIEDPKLRSDLLMKEAAESPTTGAEVQAPEIAEPQNIKIGFQEVRQGGGIERSAKAIIKANPREFGLDPDDPKLNAKAGQEAHKLARGLANKYGMTYKELNEIASHKVQPGDEIRIFKDSSTGKFNLTYNGAAFDDALSPDNTPSVSHAAAVEEIASNKPKLGPEDLKPRADVAEHQPARGAGKITSMEEIEADYKQDLAKRDYARAVRAEQDWQVRRERIQDLASKSYELANLQQGVAIRGYIEQNILPNTAIGKNISFWNGSALQWYGDVVKAEELIPSDISQTDAVNLNNENMHILKELYTKLGKPIVGQTNQEYLLEKLRDARTVELINNIIARR